jgi:type I restriction enzyme S subunit
MVQQNNIELPKGWVETKLNTISSDVSYGYTASSSIENVGPHLLRITDIQNNKVDWASVPFCKIEEIKIPKYVVEKGDLLFARTGATVGKSYLVNDDIPHSVYASYLIRVRCFDGFNIKYMAHFFNSPNYWNQITEFSSGIGQPSVNGTKLKELRIPIGPLPEQKRIVEKLDSLLAQVDTIQQRLNNLPNIIKRFRQSVLAAAVSGKLTEQWRKESADKTDFLEYLVRIDKTREEEYFDDCVKAKGNGERKPRKPSSIDEKMLFNTDWKDQFLAKSPEDWAIKALGYIGENNADSIVDGPFGASINVKRDYIDQGVPVIRINNIKPFSFVASNLKYITHEKFSELTRHNIVAGDVLFGKVGTIGDASLYPESMPEGMLSTTGCTRIRVDERVVSKEFTLIYLNAMNPAFNRIASAAVQPFLNMKTVKSFPFPIPCRKEQTEIVRLVEQYFALADTLEKNLANAKKRVDNLTQSILAKAFKGELVPQDPNDEPADKLLERIKAAREEAGKLEKAAKKANKTSKAKKK